MNCTRRNFLIGGAASVFLTGINLSSRAMSKEKKNLIIISLRGGMDGLTAVPVIGDKNLKKKRKKLIIEDTLKLNSDFALHSKLNTYYELLDSQDNYKNKFTIVCNSPEMLKA